MTQRIGILGGSFDPVHQGHLASAVALLERLGLHRLLLVPVAGHAFGKQAVASGEQRLAMLETAISGTTGLSADDVELQRPGPSYSVDTLRHYRERFGPNAMLCFAIGSDVLPQLPRWHQPDLLASLANLVVIHRAADAIDSGAKTHPVSEDERVAQDLGFTVAGQFDQPAGQVMQLKLPPQPYSSSTVRALLQQQGRQGGQGGDEKRPGSPGDGAAADVDAYLAAALPGGVREYINAHGLYRSQTDPGPGKKVNRQNQIAK